MKMREIKLGSFVSVTKGRKAETVFFLPSAGRRRYLQIDDVRHDGVPKYTEDLLGTSVRKDDLVIVWDGANAGTVGYNVEGLIGSTIARLRITDDQVFTPYLGRFLQSRFELINRCCTGATIPHVNSDSLRNLWVPFPASSDSLREQRRIVAILDVADAIRRKRRETLHRTDELLRSTFLDFFGDPATNPKQIPTKPISEFGQVITGNTPPRDQTELYGGAVEWIKSDNINTPDHFLSRATEGLSAEGKKVARLAPEGSILVTCIAGSSQCIGNAAMADREVAFNQQINAVVPNAQSNQLFLYVQFLLAKKLILATSTNSMKGMVSKSAFSAVHFLAPSKEEQDRFALHATHVLKLWKKEIAASEAADNLALSLSQRAFCGDL